MNVIALFRSETDARECERLCRVCIAGIGDMQVSESAWCTFPWSVAIDTHTGGPIERVVAFIYGYACAVGRAGSLIPSVMCKGDRRDGVTP
jgi:hypothetical protein